MSRGAQSKALRRKACPPECLCLCHDTNGGVTAQHGEWGVCPTKIGQPLEPLDRVEDS